MKKSICKSLIIGLGGTGQEVIRNLKKRVLQRYGEIPRFIRFLSFDTDKNDYQDTPFKYFYAGEYKQTKAFNLQMNEFCKLDFPHLAAIKDDPTCQNLNFEKLEMAIAKTRKPGADGSRVLGRAHFLFNANQIIRRLTDVICELKNSMPNQEDEVQQPADNSVNVYVIASLSGGTGSSAILDISRMLQNAGIDVVSSRADATADHLFGVFFLPGFFPHRRNTPTEANINAYVALSELDHALDLNDRGRFPEGCQELEDDLNIYGDAHSYTPVRYSNVYLINNKTKSGLDLSFEEAVGTVSAFIDDSMWADEHALDYVYSNSTQRLHTVEGKRQNYSSFGHCEIRFDRQNLLKYVLNRQILDILVAYKTGDPLMDSDTIVEAFLTDNRCKTGDLKDSIFQLDDGRFNISMGKVETGKEADVYIEYNKMKFVGNLFQESSMAVNEFALNKKRILTNLDLMLKNLECGKGFGHFPKIVNHLRHVIQEMKSGLEEDIANLAEMTNTLEAELNDLKDRIHEFPRTMYFVPPKEDQRQLLSSYSERVDRTLLDGKPTLKRVLLERARSEEAVKVYEEMIKILDSHYKLDEIQLGDKTFRQASGSSLIAQKAYDLLTELIRSQMGAFFADKYASHEVGVIHLDSYFKQYFDAQPQAMESLPQHAQDELESYVRGLYENGSEIDIELLERMRLFVLGLMPDGSLVKDIQENRVSLDRLFVRCFGMADAVEDPSDFERYPYLTPFLQIKDRVAPLWQYEDFRGTNSQPAESLCIIGVYDNNNHLFNEESGYRAFLPQNYYYLFTRFGNPEKIVFLTQETAIPAFKLLNAKEWENEFKANNSVFYAFSDKRLECIPMIMPD